MDIHGFDATGAANNLNAVRHFDKANQLRAEIINARALGRRPLPDVDRGGRRARPERGQVRPEARVRSGALIVRVGRNAATTRTAPVDRGAACRRHLGSLAGAGATVETCTSGRRGRYRWAMESITWRQVAALRMRRQHLLEPAPHTRLVDVVREHVGDPGAGHELGRARAARACPRPAPRRRRDALWQDRTLVKTWAMRGTLHLVAAAARSRSSSAGWARGSAGRARSGCATSRSDAGDGRAPGRDRRPAERGADDPPGARRALATQLGRPGVRGAGDLELGDVPQARAPAGWLAFGPDRGRNVTFVHPGAWLGIDIPEPVDDGFEPSSSATWRRSRAQSKGELARWWGARGKLGRRRSEAARRPARARGPRGHKAYVLAEDVEELAPPGRARPRSASSAGSTRTRCRSRRRPSRCCRSPAGRSSPEPRAGSAQSPVGGRGRRRHLDPRDQAEGDDHRAQPVAPAREGRSGEDQREAEAIGEFLAPARASAYRRRARAEARAALLGGGPLPAM